jgi:hypothetical protein
MPYYGSGMAEITLVLDKVVKHKTIYPTELLSIDPVQKTASIRVKFPEEGWREFKGREKESFGETGYYIDRISDDQVSIQVRFPINGYNYRLHYIWE